MTTRVRRKEGENLDNATVLKVTSLLSSDSPISKKEACGILNISYNTTRLANIIREFKERQQIIKETRKLLHGTSTSLREEKEIVESYLGGEAITNVAEFNYRTVQVVREVLKKYNVPERVRGSYSYIRPPAIPDEGLKENYVEGDLVFAARYNSAATIIKIHSTNSEHGTIYRIWVHGSNCCYALQPFYELSDLRKAQEELDISVEDMGPDEIKNLLFEAWIASKKGKKKDE